MNYNATDIQLYLSGKMPKAEMHVFEEAMMNDPMLADAVDGYRFAMEETDVANDLTHLAQKINTVTAAPAKVVKGSFKQWLSIAAGLLVLLSTSVVLYRIFYQATEIKTKDLTIVSKKDTAIAQVESTVDSNNLALNEDAKIPVTNTPAPVIIPSAKEKKQVSPITNEALAKNDAGDLPAPLPAKEQVQTGTKIASTNKDNTAIKPSATEIKSTASIKSETVVLNKFAGRVVDEQNNPLPFANVTETESGVGTYADVNGYFVMLSADTVITVKTKSVGYGNSVTKIKNSQSLRIILKDETIVANAPSAEVLFNKNKNRIEKETTEANEMEAEPADGWGNYNTYVANNLKNPELKRQQVAAPKQVELLFDVNPDGTVTNIKVKRSNCNQCNNEAIRILKEGPSWKSKTGKKETTRFTVQF